MKKEFIARKLDVKAFAEEGASLAGQGSVSDHGRLMQETEGRGGELPVRWSARGELRNPGHVQPQVWLHLEAGATLALTCQRCLAPVQERVEVDRLFRFVADEALAAAEDDESEEDVLAISRAFDLLELVEDELLMALPVAPRHEVCPEPVTLSAADPEFDAGPGRENPFAQLAKLKTGRH
ncbi:MAG TPA: YceD family protein [Ramlibacter sp.]|nr:YceD family protein [Ramlibacter sp.]